MFDKIPRINLKNFNLWTIVSILALIIGISFYIYWGLIYNVWYDIGSYSFSIVFIVAGFIGLILSLMNDEETEENHN